MRYLTYVLTVMLLALGWAGCATRGYVHEEVAATHARVDEVEDQVEANQARLDAQGERIDDQGERIDSVASAAENASQTAREALARAVQAGELAEGKLVFETVLSDDQVRFGFEQSRLDAEAATALDRFAEQLLTAGGGIFIEIQGHTDASGSEEYNLELGYERAQAVRRYLSMRHGLPLHRMSVISYGKASPVADNNTREGRAKNRRVVLVVLK